MKTFFLLTNVIDYSFKYTEIEQISKKYQQAYLINFEKTPMALPANVKEFTLTLKDFNGQSVLMRNKKLFFYILLQDLLLRPFNWKYYKKLRTNISFLLNCIYFGEQLKAIIQKEKLNPNDCIFLSFWLNNWSISLGVLKKQGFISKFFSRAHGFDLFEYRELESGRIPYRLFELQTVDKVFSVSQNGVDYLKEKYPAYADKIFCNYLGSENGGVNPFDEQKIFTIVSCASTRSIKRIFLIPEIIKHCNFPIHWVHLGDENLSSGDPSVPTYIKNKESLDHFPHVSFDCKGKLSTDEIFDFYTRNSVNLFISVSETEGLPVSIMEAISFGIPVMATDVGGCKEIVTAQTGILIPKDFDVKTVAEQINEFRNSTQNKAEFRTGVREFWTHNFEVNKNYKEFFNLLE